MASFRSFWFEHRFELSGSLFAFGVFLVFIAVLGSVPQARAWAATVSIFENIIVALGGWIFWEAIVGALTLLAGIVYFGDTIKKGREFERLVNTTSKEVFLRNRKRIEYLVTVMPFQYGRRVEKKRLELKIRD